MGPGQSVVARKRVQKLLSLCYKHFSVWKLDHRRQTKQIDIANLANCEFFL